ncbi:MAG: sugar ABC transporter ATP-binding protein, partial [Clostridium sp.]|uniref:ATP-binding cassette domain-containing protein n=1 Tax=Clostridium sp. TaxID=1506 RepID=UPI0025C39157
IAGLMGSGRTELAMSLFGKSYGSRITGKLIKDNKELNINNVSDAIDNGIAYVTEDRKNYGFIAIDSIKNNITLASLKNVSSNNILDDNKEVKAAEDFKSKMNIKCSDIFQNVSNLSGGNQQKVVLSKWIFSEPDILILDEPTRGIDVGAKYEIYTLINALAEEEKAIIVISSELPEVLGLSDRIYVMNEGKIVGELNSDEASQENIMSCIVNN